MTVQEMIEQMGEHVFDQFFQDCLSATCQTLPGMNFLTEENGHKAAMDQLARTMGKTELDALKQIEENYGEEFKYATLFAFRAGLCSGFGQYFVNQDIVEDGFEKCLAHGLFELPGMQRHPLLFKKREESLKIIQKLEEMTDEEQRVNLTTIGCVWEQRVYSAACHSFYCGYLAAVKVLAEIIGIDACAMMLPHTLMLEYHLGYTRSFGELTSALALSVSKNRSEEYRGDRDGIPCGSVRSA